MKTTNTTLHELATVQTAVQELYEKHIGICGISEDGVHLSQDFFVKLFEDKRELVGRKDFSKKVPFMYYTHFSGTKFFCISANPDLFPTYPVEKLAEDIIQEWESLMHPNQFRVAYADGTYKLMRSCFKDDEHISTIYTAGQHTSEESISLEQAILDHMEVMHK